MLFSYFSVWLNCAKLTVSDQLVSVSSLKVLPFKLFLLNSLCFIYFWWILIYFTLPLLYQESPIEIKNLFSKQGQEFIKSSWMNRLHFFFFLVAVSFWLDRVSFICFCFRFHSFALILEDLFQNVLLWLLLGVTGRQMMRKHGAGNVCHINRSQAQPHFSACVRVCVSVLGKRNDYQRRRSQEQ